MRYAVLPALLLAAVCAAGAPALASERLDGSGRAASEERPVSGFHGLAVSVPADVDLVQGDAEGVTLTADDNVLPKIRTFVDAQGVLEIRFPRGLDVRPRAPIRIAVRAKRVDSLSLAGRVNLQSARLRSERLKATLAGDAAIALPDVRARELALRASGHSHAMAGGTADVLDLGIAGAGEMNFARLDARQARVRIAGAAQVAAWVRERLDARITGSGAVRYFGDPRVAKRIAGSGRVERLGATPP